MKTETQINGLSDRKIGQLAMKAGIPKEHFPALTNAVRQAEQAYQSWHDIREAHRQGRLLTYRLSRLERLLTGAQELFQKCYEHPGRKASKHWDEAYGWLHWESAHMKFLALEVKNHRLHIQEVSGRPGRRTQSGVDLEDFQECIDALAEFWATTCPEEFRNSKTAPALKCVHAILKTLDNRVTMANTARLITRAKNPIWPKSKRPSKRR